MNEERRNRETPVKDKLSFGKAFGLICLALLCAVITILVINV